MVVGNIYLELLNAIKQPGCPICHLGIIAEENYFSTLLQNYLKEPGLRQDLLANRGLCLKHFRRFLDSGVNDDLTFSLVYHDILLTHINDLQAEPKPLQTRKKYFSFLHHTKSKTTLWLSGKKLTSKSQQLCPACEERNRAARKALSVWMGSFDNEVKRNDLASFDYLCLPHLRLASELMQDTPTYQTLCAKSKSKLQLLRRELVEFIRENENQPMKNDVQDMKATWEAIRSITAGE
ncbi:MAG: hypothetical protein C3F13_08425 [Anaerolineales bacterium]|nr:MAG: hypothetical protein C3F13_08425 [Anaerolineales bacterium]